MANSCNLECLGDNKGGDPTNNNIKEFVGQVKIVLVDVPKAAYICKTWYAALILLAQMLMAYTTLIIVFYSMSYSQNDWIMALHIFLCTVGFQLCIPSGILSLNKLNGSTVPMKMKDRHFEHLFIQCFGLACASAGAGIILFTKTIFTLHSCLGMAANGFVVLSGITGLYEYVFVFMSENISRKYLSGINRFIYCVHKLFGTLGFLTSSASFICGMIKMSFKSWLPLEEMLYASIVFCIFYSLVIVYKPIKQL